MSTLEERARNLLNRYTNASSRPDSVALLAEAMAEIMQLKSRVQTFAPSESGLASSVSDGPPQDLPPATFWYVNHRGEVAQRRVIPVQVYYGDTEFYKAQWLLRAIDLDRDGAERSFALDRIVDSPALFNGMSPAALERYFILIDELSGAAKAAARVLRHGPKSVNPVKGSGIPNDADLAAELGRVAGVSNLMAESGDLNREVIYESATRTPRRIKPFTHHQE